MSVLDRKLFRDLWAMRGQVLAIMLLVGSGVAMFEMFLSNYLTLRDMQSRHYAHERFGDLFVTMKRAPLAVVKGLSEIDGVAVVEPRIVHPVRVLRDDDPMSVAGAILSLPSIGQPQLNRLRLMKGRWIDAESSNEIIINEAYAEARRIALGERLQVLLNGRIQSFNVVGIALSPEFIFSSRTGLPLPDDRAFVVIWAAGRDIAAALDMKGGFNDAVFRFAPGARAEAVIAEIDRHVAKYGGKGTISRRDHPSHRFVEDELAEQRTSAVILPVIFLGIASFLFNIVVGRLVSTQREQIASLKALGYSTFPILLHYLKFVTIITAGGVVLGGLAGAWLGALMIDLYRPFFRFPDWFFEFRPWLPLAAGSLALFAALAGAFNAVWRIVILPAAVAMRPAHPHAVRGVAIIWIEGFRSLGPRALVIFRAIAGRPLRSALTALGLALAVPLVTMGLFWQDSLGYMIEFNFHRVDRSDALLSLTAPVSQRAVREVEHLPGIRLAEGQRHVLARISVGHRNFRTAIQGLNKDDVLKVPRTSTFDRIQIPSSGLVLSRRLAERLGVRLGETVDLQILEQTRPKYTATVMGLADDILGLNAYMDRSALNRLMREGSLVNAIALTVDKDKAPALWQTLKNYPRIEAISSRDWVLRVFEERIAGLIVVSALFLTGFGTLIAVGIVFNSARVTFHERVWELASLRVLGFTNFEVARILFAELALLVAIAIPSGLLLSKFLIELILRLRENETFELPAVISPETYAISALVVLCAAAGSASFVYRLIKRIDIVSVMKSRD